MTLAESRLAAILVDMSFAWLNGAFIEDAEAVISVRDTGFLHGAGVFTTMRARDGVIVRLDAHLARVRESSEILFVPMIPKDEVIAAAANELLQRNQLRDARMRLTITRGVTHQDPVHGLHAEPTLLLTATPFEPYPREFYDKGMTVIALDQQKLNPYDLQAGHKTLDYFSRFAALREAARRGAGEALWFNVHNYLQSGSISNVFLVKDGALLTPPTQVELREEPVRAKTPYPKSNVLPGTTRHAVLELAAELGAPIVKQGLSINDLLDADEVFLTNSAMDIMPVCHVEKKAIGAGVPGPVTRQLSEALR